MELTFEDKRILEEIYGTNCLSENSTSYIQNQIEDVQKLTDAENRFFERKNFISPYFCVQTLYKVKGELSPIKFNRAVKNLIETDENFRANFCNSGDRAFKVFFSRRDKFPEIVFRVIKFDGEELDEILTKIMEADRRVSFDIVHGNLIRFSAFNTGENEAAILVTVSQLIADRFNSENFFNAVFNETPYKKFIPNADIKPLQIEERVKNYWADLLKGLPSPPQVPYSKKVYGAYKEENYRAKIPADILSDLRGKAQSNRALLMTILQTAWGFLLQATNKIDDTAFCQLISGKSNKNFSLNLMPVRLKCAKISTVENIVTQQFKQLVVSQPYSFFNWETLQNLTYRKNIFDHFLSFVDFNAEEKTYSQISATPEGKIVERNSWDAQGMKLGVYFQYSQNLSVTFQYDKNKFSINAGEYLANLYNLILRQMLVYWNAPFADFIENVKKLVKSDIAAVQEISAEDERQKIIDFIYQNKILQSKGSGVAQIFAESAKLFTRFEGDRIFGDILDKNLVFVVEGKVSRSLDTGDGWFNALDIIKAGGLINENIFTEKSRAIISAEILTEKALLMTIPIENFESATRQNPALYKSVLQHVTSQMEKYQVLWLQS